MVIIVLVLELESLIHRKTLIGSTQDPYELDLESGI